MSTTAKRLTIFIVVVIGLISASLVNLFVYPFTSVDPNFSDVERVFNKIQIPSDWVEISSSENRGIAGRACPVEPGSACFHKGKRFTVPSRIKEEDVISVIVTSGCPGARSSRSEPIGGSAYTNYTCSIEGLEVSGSLIEQETGWELSVYVSS